MSRARLLEIVVLVATLLAAGIVLVPAHWTSLWADVEFTGWVVPIANRLHDGARLYTDGLHLPVPPLAFVLTRLAFGGHGVWLHESLLNFIGQSVAILALYDALSSALPAPAPFISAFATIPLFLYLAKTIAYDAIAQACVALAMAALIRTLAGSRRALIALAVSTAACLLTKVNTGAGVLGGTTIALVLLPIDVELGSRVRRAAGYLGLTLAAIAVLLVTLLPWVSLRGFIADVVLTGAEPKGGTPQMIANLRSFIAQLLVPPSPRLVTGLGMIALAVALWRGVAPRPYRSLRMMGLVLAVALAAGVHAFRAPVIVWLPGFSSFAGDTPMWILAVGLYLALALIALLAAGRSFLAKWPPFEALAALACVAIPAALLHSLSVTEFRWTYDNNPLIAVAIATPLVVLAHLLPGRMMVVMYACTAALTWSTVGDVAARLRSTTVPWPEIPHLAGARMPMEAEGLRRAVRAAREAAGEHGTLLMLPEDVDVVAWIGHPRPALKGAIIFADQYWPRYVEEDFACLVRDPPTAILIAPLGYTRLADNPGLVYSHAAFTLMDRVERELLPAMYGVPRRFPIRIRGLDDYADLYVRQDNAWGSMRPQRRRMLRRYLVPPP